VVFVAYEAQGLHCTCGHSNSSLVLANCDCRQGSKDLGASRLKIRVRCGCEGRNRGASEGSLCSWVGDRKTTELHFRNLGAALDLVLHFGAYLHVGVAVRCVSG
jgi:hypothetical protein